MLNFRYIKTPPTTYVVKYVGGKIKEQGAGLSFFYDSAVSTIVTIPMASADAPFVFNESTADFQTLMVQGQLTYRIADPARLAAMLDFSIAPKGNYASDDPKKLPERLVHNTQIFVRGEIQKLTLREALVASDAIGRTVLAGLRNSEEVAKLGVEVLNIAILALRPTPEMAKALEADAREALNRRSDEAIYARRNASVEQERRIKESELNTEIAVEEKQRQIRETHIATEILLERQRAELTDQKVENDRKEADSRAYALEAMMKPIRGADWRTLMMVSGNATDPKNAIALAFHELASNAGNIGQLNITPDLLKSLLGTTAR